MALYRKKDNKNAAASAAATNRAGFLFETRNRASVGNIKTLSARKNTDSANAAVASGNAASLLPRRNSQAPIRAVTVARLTELAWVEVATKSNEMAKVNRDSSAASRL